MLVGLVHGYILFLKLRHMCDGLVKFDPSSLFHLISFFIILISIQVHGVIVVNDSPKF